MQPRAGLAAALGGELQHYSDAGHGVSEQHAGAVNEALATLWRRGEARRAGRRDGAALAPPKMPDLHPGLLAARALVCGWLLLALRRRRHVGGGIAAEAVCALGAAVYARRCFTLALC